MAFDYGARRTGIAVTDPLQIIATGLETVETEKLFDFLKNYLRQEKVSLFVVGEPFNLNGRPAQSAEMIKKFADKLQKAFPDIPVEREDETLTSRMAARAMVDAGIRKKQRQKKGNLDLISAVLILQSYLERR